jgi:hypothetical protein
VQTLQQRRTLRKLNGHATSYHPWHFFASACRSPAFTKTECETRAGLLSNDLKSNIQVSVFGRQGITTYGTLAQVGEVAAVRPEPISKLPTAVDPI